MNHSGQMMTMDTRGIVATSRGSKESIFSTNRGRIIILLLLICIPLISYWEDIVIVFVQPPTQNNGIKLSQQSQDAFNSYKLNTPLFEAVKSDDIELVRKLLNDGENNDNNNNNNDGGKVVYYNVNAEDPKGLTPLIEATLIGNVDIVKLLLVHGAKPQPLQGFRHTPLRAACLTGNTELITLLIEQGADPNAKSAGGRTPLMGACYLRPQYDESPERIEISYEAIRVMLEDSRVDPTIRNDFNESAMDLCKQRGYTKSMGILRDRITGGGKRKMRRR